MNIKNESFRRLKISSYSFAIIACVASLFGVATLLSVAIKMLTETTIFDIVISVSEIVIGLSSIVLLFGLSVIFRKEKLYRILLLIMMAMQICFFICTILLVYIDLPDNVELITNIVVSICILINVFISFTMGLNFLNNFSYIIVKNMGIALLINSLIELSIVFIQYVGLINIIETWVTGRRIIYMVDNASYTYFLCCVSILFFHYSKGKYLVD